MREDPAFSGLFGGFCRFEIDLFWSICSGKLCSWILRLLVFITLLGQCVENWDLLYFFRFAPVCIFFCIWDRLFCCAYLPQVVRRSLKFWGWLFCHFTRVVCRNLSIIVFRFARVCRKMRFARVCTKKRFTLLEYAEAWDLRFWWFCHFARDFCRNYE